MQTFNLLLPDSNIFFHRFSNPTKVANKRHTRGFSLQNSHYSQSFLFISIHIYCCPTQTNYVYEVSCKDSFRGLLEFSFRDNFNLNKVESKEC
ncbi:hypothetical protein EHV08_04745 [Prevotella koreensis]|uniref:Uncharacterized protein n=1 Tax=Prevotella koreensis TaxID=2490854 RepID=A0A3S0P815_9BACT|nr:hypothetical protein EHV08_04745 [Prevotella koreensis]